MCFSIFKKKNVEPPKPQTEIQAAGTMDIHEMSSILLDYLDSIGDENAGIFLPDGDCKIYSKIDVMNYLGLDETSEIAFVDEIHDCDDFAAKMFGKFAGLVWTGVHALNWFIDTENKLWFVEPQNDKIADRLEDWQGAQVRFFLGR